MAFQSLSRVLHLEERCAAGNLSLGIYVLTVNWFEWVLAKLLRGCDVGKFESSDTSYWRIKYTEICTEHYIYCLYNYRPTVHAFAIDCKLSRCPIIIQN